MRYYKSVTLMYRRDTAIVTVEHITVLYQRDGAVNMALREMKCHTQMPADIRLRHWRYHVCRER